LLTSHNINKGFLPPINTFTWVNKFFCFESNLSGAVIKKSYSFSTSPLKNSVNADSYYDYFWVGECEKEYFLSGYSTESSVIVYEYPLIIFGWESNLLLINIFFLTFKSLTKVSFEV
jgi:hypothetical protein